MFNAMERLERSLGMMPVENKLPPVYFTAMKHRPGFNNTRKPVYNLGTLNASINRTIIIVTSNTNCEVTGKLEKIQREDGSGRCWNILIDGVWHFVYAEYN